MFPGPRYRLCGIAIGPLASNPPGGLFLFHHATTCATNPHTTILAAYGCIMPPALPVFGAGPIPGPPVRVDRSCLTGPAPSHAQPRCHGQKTWSATTTGRASKLPASGALQPVSAGCTAFWTPCPGTPTRQGIGLPCIRDKSHPTCHFGSIFAVDDTESVNSNAWCHARTEILCAASHAARALSGRRNRRIILAIHHVRSRLRESGYARTEGPGSLPAGRHVRSLRLEASSQCPRRSPGGPACPCGYLLS